MLAYEVAVAAADYRHALRLRASSIVKRRPAAPAGDAAPVVLLPGGFETWHYLRPIGERLAIYGHPVHVLPQLGFQYTIPGAADYAWQDLCPACKRKSLSRAQLSLKAAGKAVDG